MKKPHVDDMPGFLVAAVKDGQKQLLDWKAECGKVLAAAKKAAEKNQRLPQLDFNFNDVMKAASKFKDDAKKLSQMISLSTPK